MDNNPGEIGFNGDASRFFYLRTLGEEEIFEAMKMGTKRRAAVVKSKDKEASAQEAARLAARRSAGSRCGGWGGVAAAARSAGGETGDPPSRVARGAWACGF